MSGQSRVVTTVHSGGSCGKFTGVNNREFRTNKKSHEIVCVHLHKRGAAFQDRSTGPNRLAAVGKRIVYRKDEQQKPWLNTVFSSVDQMPPDVAAFLVADRPLAIFGNSPPIRLAVLCEETLHRPRGNAKPKVRKKLPRVSSQPRH